MTCWWINWTSKPADLETLPLCYLAVHLWAYHSRTHLSAPSCMAVGRTHTGESFRVFVCSHPFHMSRNCMDEIQQEFWRLNTRESFPIQPHVLPTVWKATRNDTFPLVLCKLVATGTSKVRKKKKRQKWLRALLIKLYFPSCNLLI